MNIVRFIRSSRTALLLVTVACASQPDQVRARPDRAPAVTLVQITRAVNLGQQIQSGLPVDYRLRIVNSFDYAIRLRWVEMESVGDSGAYSLERVRHRFDRLIPAKSSDAIEFRAWVRPLQVDSRGDTSTPVALRGTAQFDSEAGKTRRNFVARGQ